VFAAAYVRDGSVLRATSLQSSAAAFSVTTDGESEALRAQLSSAPAHCRPRRCC